MTKRVIEAVTLTESEAADYLGISVDLIRRLRNDGRLPHVRLGDRVIYYPPALDEFLMRESMANCQKTGGISRVRL